MLVPHFVEPFIITDPPAAYMFQAAQPVVAALLISVDDVAFVPAWASISRTEMVFSVRLEHGKDGRWRAVVPVGSRFVRTYLRPREGDVILAEVTED